jgi:hypothetical protein
MLINISEITADSLIQPRETLNKEKLTEYGKILSNGEDLDPVDLCYDGSVYWLADGFHRLEVYRLASKTHIPADIRQGTRRDAILVGIERNVKHGLGLTLAERKNAARRLLLDSEWRVWSNRKIGRICGLNHETVSAIKNNLNSNQSIPITNKEASEDLPESTIKATENPSGGNRQIQNFTNTRNLDLVSTSEIFQSVSGGNRQIQSFTNTPATQTSIRKTERNGREYTIDTSNIGRSQSQSQKISHNANDAIVDITATTETVYEFLLTTSDPSLDTFRIFDANYATPIAIDNKLEFTLKLISSGPAHAMPLIVQQMIAFPSFAQFIFNQAQQLANNPPELKTDDHLP